MNKKKFVGMIFVLIFLIYGCGSDDETTENNTTAPITGETKQTTTEPKKESSTVFVTDWQKEVQKVLYNEVWQGGNGCPFTFKFDEGSFIITKFEELSDGAKRKNDETLQKFVVFYAKILGVDDADHKFMLELERDKNGKVIADFSDRYKNLSQELPLGLKFTTRPIEKEQFLRFDNPITFDEFIGLHVSKFTQDSEKDFNKKTEMDFACQQVYLFYTDSVPSGPMKQVSFNNSSEDLKALYLKAVPDFWNVNNIAIRDVAVSYYSPEKQEVEYWLATAQKISEKKAHIRIYNATATVMYNADTSFHSKNSMGVRENTSGLSEIEFWVITDVKTEQISEYDYEDESVAKFDYKNFKDIKR